MGFYWYEAGVRSSHHERSSLASSHAPATRPLPTPGRDAYRTHTDAVPRRQQAIVARQIMAQRVVTLPETALFDEIYHLLRARRFRHVPIVDARGLLLGIVSDRDVLREAATSQREADGMWIAEIVREQRTAAQFMTTKVLVATPTTEIRQIAKAMFEERIGSMPVIDDAHHLVGLITRSDILRTLINSAPLELWI